MEVLFGKKEKAPPAPAPEPVGGSKEEHKFGWEKPMFKGAYEGKSVKRQLSTVPDEMEMFREHARSMRLIEAMSDDGNSEAAIASYPKPHKLQVSKEINMEKALEVACHRKCGSFWRAYTKCQEELPKAIKADPKKSAEYCEGWFTTYTHCLDKTSTTMMLNVLTAMTKDDPEMNVQKLRQ